MPEVGIRMAFGASPRDVLRELVHAATRCVLAGVVGGVALTIGVVRAAPLLSSASPTIDMSYAAAVVATLVVCSLAASVVPALRARGARPAELLRRA